jgi:hypothetical protein
MLGLGNRCTGTRFPSRELGLPGLHARSVARAVTMGWLPRLHARSVARTVAMGKEQAQWRFIAIPFSGCRSQSSVDVVHAGKEPQVAWLRAQSKVSFFYSMHTAAD